MPKVLFTRDWKWAEQGMFVHSFAKDEIKEVSEECAAAAYADKVGKTLENKENPEEKNSLGESVPEAKNIPTGEGKPASSSRQGQVFGKKTSNTAKAKQKSS